MTHVYGLGQEFRTPGSADGDWTAHGRRQGLEFGNGFQGFQDAAVGNVQIPVLYALGAGTLNYALLLDNVYRQNWDFTALPVAGAHVRRPAPLLRDDRPGPARTCARTTWS